MTEAPDGECMAVELIGSSPAFRQVLDAVSAIAPVDRIRPWPLASIAVLVMVSVPKLVPVSA